MSEPASERRMAENEVIFRAYNERVKNGFDELKKIAKEDNQEIFVTENDIPLQFYCECSDEHCQKRIRLKPSRYTKIHIQRNHFVIICGHEIKGIEHVINTATNFCVIENL